MQSKKSHWPSLLILIVLGLSAACLMLIALGLGINSTIDLVKDNGGDPAGQMISAFAFGFVVIILFVCSWFVLQKTMGREQAERTFKMPFASWQIFSVILLVFISGVFGGVIAYTQIAWLAWIILPVLTVLVIVPPIWILFGIGTNGIELGPRWRVFGMVGLSLTIGPLLMILLEIVLLLGIIVLVLALVSIQQPALFQQILHLGRMVRQETSTDMVLKLLAPYISNPIVIAILLGYIALLVPMIEELLKPLAVWIFARQIESPAQGFAMGLLSGGAFALIESLNASGDGSTSWPFIVGIRTMTSLLHMMASGLVGWGIVSAFREKRILRFFTAYFSAVAIHGLWNACAVGAGLSTVGEFIGKPEWLFNIIPAMTCGMSVLAIGMFSVLVASNKKLKSLPITPLPMLPVQAESKGVQ